jgi:hypothetical protein
VVLLKKSNRMRKEKTDRDPDLEVSGVGHRSGGSQKHTGQVRSQVRGSRKPEVRSNLTSFIFKKIGQVSVSRVTPGTLIGKLTRFLQL